MSRDNHNWPFKGNNSSYFDSTAKGDLVPLQCVCLEIKRQEVEKRVSVVSRGRRNGVKELARQGQVARVEAW